MKSFKGRAQFELQFTKLHEKFKDLHKIEIEMLKHGGLVLGENLSIMDVPLNDEEGNYIHTLTCGDPRNPPLLLIHGYAGSAVFFYLMLKELSKEFKVYAIDFIGNGSSRRCKFDIQDAQGSIDFTVEKIDLWRKSLKIEKMYILGHSLGGTLAGWYALKRPERVFQAYFVSSAGFGTEFTSDSDVYQICNDFNFVKRSIVKLFI